MSCHLVIGSSIASHVFNTKDRVILLENETIIFNSSEATKCVFNYAGNVIISSVLIWYQEEKFLMVLSPQGFVKRPGN